MYGRIRKIHFVGIGGIGMSGIAEVLLNLNYGVSGSDLRASETTERLAKLGGQIYLGHAKNNIEGADVVVTSTAVKADNPEVIAARKRHIPVIPRAEMLAELMRMKYGIAVAGTHGKTTTTSMIATLLVESGVDPTAVIGGRLDAFGSNAKLGQGKFLVAEADESDGSFLHLTPTIAVVTNIDEDHLDYYQDLDEIKQVFIDFVNKVPFFGTAVLCLDDNNVQEIIPQVNKRYTTYGFSSQAEYRATDVEYYGDQSQFMVHHRDQELGQVTIQMPGRHNVLNALASIVVGRELSVSFSDLQQGFKDFGGVGRRFQHRYDGEVMVIDDYGHHPTEIKATLAAAKKGWNRRVIAVFQPHRYSRTEALFSDFLTAFNQADAVIVTDVYAAGEDPIEGVCGRSLAEGIAEHGHRKVKYLGEFEQVLDYLKATLEAGDILITLGAGNIWQVAQTMSDMFLEQNP